MQWIKNKTLLFLTYNKDPMFTFLIADGLWPGRIYQRSSFKSKGRTQHDLLKVNGTSHNEQKVAIFTLSKEYFLKVCTHFTEPLMIMGHKRTPQSRKHSFIINKKSDAILDLYAYSFRESISYITKKKKKFNLVPCPLGWEFYFVTKEKAIHFSS